MTEAAYSPLLDWQQWLLAIITGLVASAFYAWVTDYTRTRRWRSFKRRLYHEIFVEVVWVWVCMRMVEGFSVGAELTESRPLHRMAAHLRDLIGRGGPIGDQVPWSQLSPAEQHLVNSGLTLLRKLARELLVFTERLLQLHATVWSERERETLLRAAIAIRRFAEWDAPTNVQPGRFEFEIFRALDLAQTALEGMQLMLDMLPATQKLKEPIPISKVTDL
jgi:hypothetical protein